MSLRSYQSAAPALAILFATSACGNGVSPDNTANAGLQGWSARAGYSRPADTTSILKLLKKDVVIGSTVDPTNDDKGPLAVSIVGPHNLGGLLREGQLVVCNFENSAGTAGNGTTIEVLNPKHGSSPERFYQSRSIQGCDSDAINSQNAVYAGGLTSGKLVKVSRTGKAEKIYSGQPITAPFADTVGLPEQPFSPEYTFVGTTSGGIVSISEGFYGNGLATQVAEGFGVNKDSGWSALAPSGLQYNRGLDTLYIVDGVTNTVVAFSHASELLEENEIVVKPGGKTFVCEHRKVTCGSLVYGGKPLDAPAASTLLPNGNLIVANTQGTANTLVELTPRGQILDTKVVDSSKTQGVYGLAAAGTDDSNTVLFFTDTNSNNVQELEQ